MKLKKAAKIIGIIGAAAGIAYGGVEAYVALNPPATPTKTEVPLTPGKITYSISVTREVVANE